ncbi:hypothetical protein JT318_gp12 [Pseudomonas phage PspYZU01]|uniref:Uncharacterized protein n=1 Tax=Pseudomonas phage PspYZU01 TaxID=1983555 RepID=A0A2U7NMU7_9CAUD|nr:hypothetical protein JT318_gp12 [Pseudomonas phage PspYZU01]ASD51897.1 hypothetical protein PspYZU01_12 [Pseudomonas phage PspYZU01]
MGAVGFVLWAPSWPWLLAASVPSVGYMAAYCLGLLDPEW